MGGGGIPVSQMTNRQLFLAAPLVFLASAVIMCLAAAAFAQEWSGDGRVLELLGSALIFMFIAVFVVYLETAFIRELLNRRRKR